MDTIQQQNTYWQLGDLVVIRRVGDPYYALHGRIARIIEDTPGAPTFELVSADNTTPIDGVYGPDDLEAPAASIADLAYGERFMKGQRVQIDLPISEFNGVVGVITEVIRAGSGSPLYGVSPEANQSFTYGAYLARNLRPYFDPEQGAATPQPATPPRFILIAGRFIAIDHITAIYPATDMDSQPILKITLTQDETIRLRGDDMQKLTQWAEQFAVRL